MFVTLKDDSKLSDRASVNCSQRGLFLLPNRIAVTIRRYKARSGYHLLAAYRQPLFVCPNIFNC